MNLKKSESVGNDQFSELMESGRTGGYDAFLQRIKEAYAKSLVASNFKTISFDEAFTLPNGTPVLGMNWEIGELAVSKSGKRYFCWNEGSFPPPWDGNVPPKSHKFKYRKAYESGMSVDSRPVFEEKNDWIRFVVAKL